MPPQDLRNFAEDWVASWNAHDLEAILHHYCEEIVLYSAMIARVTGAPGPSISGLDALRTYWSRALELTPELHFDLEAVLAGADSLTILYTNHRGRLSAETFVFNAASKVVLSVATYADS